MSATKISETVRELEQALGRCFAACEHFRRGTGAPASAARPWHALEVDRVAECVLIDGQPVPEGALLELCSDGGPLLVRLCDVTRATAWGRLELHAAGAHDLIPVAVRLYAGALARLAHAAEGRRD